MRAAVLTGCAVFAFASSGNGQTVTLGPDGVTQSQGLGRAFQTFSILGGTPGIAAARYYSNFDLDSYQLPIGHSFQPIEGGLLSGVSPYAEITLGYLTGNQTFPLTSDGNSPNSVKLTFNSWSALAGAGIDVPLGNGFKIRPIVLVGFSHVSGDAQFYGPGADVARSQVLGVLANASLNSVLLGGALELVYQTPLRGNVNLTAQARYNELAALVTSASSSALQGDGSFGVATASVMLTGPTGWQIANNDLHWLGYAKGTWLPDTNPSVLGFNGFAELGGGLKIIAPEIIRGVQGATFRASAIVGPNVTGWLVSAALNF